MLIYWYRDNRIDFGWKALTLRRRCFLFLFVEIVSVKEGEKNAITVTSVDNSESANEYNDCQDTLDKVYLLSYNEAMEMLCLELMGE